MERRPTEPSDPGFRPFSYSSWMRFRMRSCDVKVRVGGVESVVGMGSRQISVADRAAAQEKGTDASATVDAWTPRGCAYRRGHPEGVGRVLGLAFLIFSHRRPLRDEDSSARLEVPILRTGPLVFLVARTAVNSRLKENFEDCRSHARANTQHRRRGRGWEGQGARPSRSSVDRRQ